MSDTAALSRLALHVLQPGFDGTEPPEWVRRRISEGLGSVLLFGRNVRNAEQLAALTAELHAQNPDVIVAMDEEGGDVTRLEAGSGSSYPGNLALGVVDDLQLTRRVARSLGWRLAEVGVDLDYAPVADVNSNRDNPVIGVRSFGADPDLVARHVAAFVDGLQSTGTAACAKHFPGHGDTSVDSHVALPTVRMNRAELSATALPPFRAALDAGVRAVMLGHLLLPALDRQHPATVSPAGVDLLREELGFKGLIVTDAVEMAAVERRYGVEGAAVRALAAGADLLCVGSKGDDALVARLQAAIVDAVHVGRLAPERLLEASGRVLDFLAKGRRERSAGRAQDSPDHGAIGLEAARRSLRVTVLVPGALPLSSPPHHVALVAAGPAALGSVADSALGAQLKSLMPGTTVARLGECTDSAVAGVLAEASGRPLVLGVRSAHRHRWMDEALTRILAARPDAIVAELGLPGTAPRGAAYLVAHGASRVCARVVAQALCPPALGAAAEARS